MLQLYRIMLYMDTFDIVVLGAGSGGLTAARTAAKFGVRVALLEKGKIGGDCLHTGCVPSKSLIAIARQFNSQKNLETYFKGSPQNRQLVDFARIRQAIRANQQTIINSSDNAESLAVAGITVMHGAFSFQNRHTLVSHTGQKFRFKKCIIATGSKPNVPKINGLEQVQYLTSDTIWDETKLPDSLTVIGAGPIGLELGQAFAMLGSQVTVFERSERLVSRFDQPVSDALQKGLEESGVHIILNSSVNSVASTRQATTIQYTQGTELRTLNTERVLVATGRVPNTGQLGLETVGLQLNERGGIVVDKKLRTRAKHIYAIGDCLAGPLFTHWAAEQGTNAALHALFGFHRGLNANALPSVTFTTPEIAQVGTSEQQLKADKVRYTKLELPYDNIDKAIAEQEHGQITVLVDQKRRILGAHVIGHAAGELIGYFSLLLNKKVPLDALAGPVQAYPTYTIALKQLAGEQRLAGFRRTWLSRLLLKIRY